MKKSYLPLILLPLLAILCGLLLWTDWQSGQSLRAARAEVQAMQSKMALRTVVLLGVKESLGQPIGIQKLRQLLVCQCFGLLRDLQLSGQAFLFHF